MITYLPNKIVRKMKPRKAVDGINRRNAKKKVASMVNAITELPEKAKEKITLKVLKDYREDYQELIDEGKDDLVQSRIENNILNQVKEEIKKEYRGEFYEWLPSDAETPDPLHQLKYGKTYQIGKGEMPQDRFGCRCGMRIIVDETKLDL